MSNNFHRRRRRTGSTSARYRPATLVPNDSAPHRQFGKSEVGVCCAVLVVVGALISLIWILATREIQEQRDGVRERAEQLLLGQAATIAETVTHELLMIDQSLTIIQDAWKMDSKSVDLVKWRANMPALFAVADDLFIADEKHVIQQDIMPKAIGQGVGAAYVTFPHGSLEQIEFSEAKENDSTLLQDPESRQIEARQFLSYVVRPLDRPEGWLVGASYRSAELAKLVAKAALGFNPVAALVDTRHGALQAVVGPAARRPKTDFAKSPLFGMLTRSPAGVWLGETAADGVERLHAFHRIPGRDMSLVVAMSWAEVMAPADHLAAGARFLALLGSVTTVLIGALVMWALRRVRDKKRQQRHFERIKHERDRLRGEAAGLSNAARLDATRLQVLLSSTSDGVAVFDANLRLIQVNDLFVQRIGISLHQAMPLDTMLRAQAAASLFQSGSDIETEIALRLGSLRTGSRVSYTGSDNMQHTMQGYPTGDGSLILLLTPPLSDNVEGGSNGGHLVMEQASLQ